MARFVLEMACNMSVWGGVFIHGFNFNYAVKCYTAEALMFKQIYWSKSTVIDKKFFAFRIGE